MALTVFAASPEIMKVVPGADAEVSAASYPALKTINYKVTGDQRKDIVGFAKTQVGYAEKSGNNTYFGAWYGMNKQPWCAMFICWAASKAGVATSIIPKLANADRGWAKKQGVYYKSRQWGGNYTPKPGDLIYFSWSVRDYADHIGMVSGTGKSGGTTYVYTIEGNKHDKVKEGSYAINNRYILGYASPKYTSSTPTTTIKPTTTTTTTSTQPTTAAITVRDGEYLLKYRDGLTETENEDTLVAPVVGTFGKDLTISSYKFNRPGYDYNTWNIYREDKGKLYYLCRDKAGGATEKWYLFSSIPSDYALATVGIGGKLRVNTKVPGPLYLTPVWCSSGYAVTYNANGGQNAPAGQTKKQGQALTLQKGVPTRSGCTFQGWAETANASVPQYSAGGSYTADKSVTLFAVWKSGSFQVKLTGDLYIRKGPAKSYESVGVLKKGKTVTVVETKDGWARLTDGNWISMKYTQTITTAAPTTKPTTQAPTKPTVPQITTTRAASSAAGSASTAAGAGVYKTKATLNKRKGPGKNYKVVTAVKKGREVTIVEVKDGWGRASDGGWMSMKYLKKVSSAPAATTVAAQTAGFFKVKVSVGALNRRSGPGTAGKKKGALHKGDQVKITRVSDGWGQIKDNGSWIMLKYTTVTSGCKVRVPIDYLPMRKGPGKKYDKVGVVQPGVHDISKINGTWGKLRSNGSWIHLGYTTWAY